MRTVHVVGAAIFRNGHVLTALRSETMALPNQWEFPGGKLEDGETPQEALYREIHEELGVCVEVLDFIARGEHHVRDARIVLDVYRCALLTGEPEAREHAELRWMEPAELETLTFAKADIPAVHILSRNQEAT